MQRLLFAVAMIALAALTGCLDDDKSPYLELRGGGFQFNYRIAEATATMVLASLRTLPANSVVEVNFENPAGGAPIVLRKQVGADDTAINFSTPPLTGIVKDKPYQVTIRLLDKDGKELQRIDKPYRSNLDQSILPEKPLVVGPGYAPNPDLPSKN